MFFGLFLFLLPLLGVLSLAVILNESSLSFLPLLSRSTPLLFFLLFLMLGGDVLGCEFVRLFSFENGFDFGVVLDFDVLDAILFFFVGVDAFGFER